MSNEVRTPTPSLISATELEGIALPGKVTELVRGRLLVREPPGTRHGVVAMNLGYHLADHVRRHDLGVVLAQDTGFKIESDPDTVRAPDVAFVTRERAEGIPPRGYAELAPDLVAEVLSPDDRPGEVLAKVGAWLAAGVRLVWVVDPDRSEARIYRADGSLAVLGARDALDGEDVLPGFRCSMEQVLA